MRYAVLCMIGGLVFVFSLAAQVPTQPPGNAPPPGSFQPPGGRGSRGGPGGFGTRVPQTGSTVQPPRSEILDRPEIGLPRDFAPLPELGTAGRMLMLDVLVA